MQDQFMKYMAEISNPSISEHKITLEITQKKKIYISYMQMYRGLVMVNWTRGGTLGQSMYLGMEQTKSFVESKKSDNPAVMYLKQIQASHRVVQARNAMTHPRRDMEMQISPEQRQAFMQRATAQVNQAMGGINGIIAQHQSRAHNNNQETKREQPMHGIMTENGSMTYSETAANAKQSAKTVNPSKKILESDQERQARQNAQMQNKTNKFAEESENGSLTKSAQSANNKNSERTVNPSKTHMHVHRPATVRDDKKDTKFAKFKNAQARMLDLRPAEYRDKKLTPEQQMWLWKKQHGDMAA